MKKRISLLLSVWLAVSSALCGCNMVLQKNEKIQESSTDLATASEETEIQGVKKAEEQDISQVHLRDKDLLYSKEDETNVTTMYLTVSRGNDAENTNHSWEEINSYSVFDYEEMGVPRYQVAALLQVGDENGPVAGEVGYGETVPNATVQIRGQSSSKNPQKNYKIKLKENKGSWEGQQTIALNKHMSEGLRFRNKLCYDLLKGIPQIMSLRTRFVHLYVKDTTSGKDAFEDYGLYTQVEQLNKTALEAHGLQKNGQLYKVNYFEFYRYEDTIMTEDTPGFDLSKFEERLEIKGDHDHTKLIQMLDDLNNYSIPVSDVLKQHFDEENLLYWMAFQILVGNSDTQSRNCYLYSPTNSPIWYILPWDNDGSFFNTEWALKKNTNRGSWEVGVSNYWGNILFQRCLKSDAFREKLDQVIEELRRYLSEERLEEMVEQYAGVVQPYVEKMPDQLNEPLTPEEYEQVKAGLPKEVEQNYEMYRESLEKPMPFYIGRPVTENGKLKINWDASYDFDAEDITYSVEIARDYQFAQVIYKEEQTLIPEILVDIPDPGQYFVRIRATNESGKTQDAFDYYVTNTGKQYGMICFYINEDHTVGVDAYEEE